MSLPKYILIVPLQRFLNEAHVWTLLHQQGVDVVPLVGVYSTETHPFGFVYEYMDGLDLKQYLRNKHGVDRLNLVRIPIHPPSTANLLTVPISASRNRPRLESYARPGRHPRTHPYGTLSLHPACSRHIIHLRLVSQVNILVDKNGIPRITGLGNATVLPSAGSATKTERGRASADQLSRYHAPEITWPGTPLDPTGPMRPTKASDMYAFGVMAGEVRTNSDV